MKLGEAADMRVEAIPTGALSLDLALGVGGIPRGHVTGSTRPESSGKTTICLHVIAEAQRMGGTCALSTSSAASTRTTPAHRRQDRRPLCFAAGHRRAGSGDRRSLGALWQRWTWSWSNSVAALVPRAEIEGEMATAIWACRLA